MDNIKFNGVEDTLFIPLASRAEASVRFPDYFHDEKSLTFKDLPQVKAIIEKTSEYSMLASVSRYYNTDEMVRTFAKNNGRCSVVNLGAGLETLNYRLTNCNIAFYQVDFPDVIKTRRQIMGTADNEILIGCDITDMSWTNKVDKEQPVLLIASGVFQYFKPKVVSELISDMKNSFDKPHLIFDATNETGVKYAEKYVKKTGNQNAMMYFYINDAEDFCRNEHIRLIEVRGFYDAARKELKGLGLYTKIAMKVADKKKRTMIIHAEL